MATIGELTVDLEMETRSLRNGAKAVTDFANDVNRKFNTASRSVDKFGATTKRVLNDTANQLNSIGKNLSLRLTLPILGAGIVVTKFGGDAELAFTKVTKVLGSTAEEAAGLKRELIDLANTVPVATNELFSIAEAAARLGVPTDKIEQFTRVTAQLADATTLTTDSAATSLARLANITGDSLDNVERMGSAIVHLGNNLATTEDEIAGSALRLASLSKIAGLTSAEILGLAAATSAVGLNPELTGTSLKKIFFRLQEIVREGGTALDLVSSISGTTSQGFAETFRGNNLEGLSLFAKGLGEAQRQGVELGKVFDDIGLNSVRVIEVMTLMAGSFGVFEEALDLSTTAYKENVALRNEVERFYATFNKQIRLLLNPIRQLAVDLGQSLLPIFKEWVQSFRTGILPTLQGAVKFLTELSDTTKTTIVVFGGLLAALGPLAIGLGILLKFVSGALLLGIGLVAAKVLVFVGALAVLIANLDTVIYTLRRVRNFLVDVFVGIGQAIVDLVSFILTPFRAIRDAIFGIIGDVAEELAKISPPPVTIPGIDGETEEHMANMVKHAEDMETAAENTALFYNEIRRDAERLDKLAAKARENNAEVAKLLDLFGDTSGLGDEFSKGLGSGIGIGGAFTQEFFEAAGEAGEIFGEKFRTSALLSLTGGNTLSGLFVGEGGYKPLADDAQITQFTQDVTNGFTTAMDNATKNVFRGNKSIIEIFQQAAHEFTLGLQDGVAGAFSRKAGELFSKGFSNSVESLKKTLGPSLKNLTNSLSDSLPEGFGEKAGAIASGGLAVVGGIQQGGVGGFLSGAAGGASIGAAVGGPVGAIVGGIIGGVASLFGGGKKEKIRVEAEAFTVSQALTADFADGIGLGFLRGTEKGIGDFNASDAEILTGLAIQDYLKGVRTSLEKLPGSIREEALRTLDNFQFDAQKLFGESGKETVQSFRSFLEGGLSGNLTRQLEPVFVEVFKSMGASAERASEYFNNRFEAIASAHSQEVAKQLEQRFREDFAAFTDIANLVEGNTGIAGAVDRTRFLLNDLGVELEGALTFDNVIDRARELVAALDIDSDVASKIREVTGLLVDIPLKLSSAIRGSISSVRSLGEYVRGGLTKATSTLLGGVAERNVARLGSLLKNQNLSIEQRGAILREQASSIQTLIGLEKQRFEAAKRQEVSRLESQLKAYEDQIQALEGFKSVVESAKRGLDSLQFGAESILSPAEQLTSIFNGPNGINSLLSIPEGARSADQQQRLTELLPEAVRIAREGFGEGSSAAFHTFALAQETLSSIQEAAKDRLDLQLELMAQHETLLTRIAEVNERDFQMSERLNKLVEENMKEQIELMELQEETAQEQLEGINQLDKSIKKLDSNLQAGLSRIGSQIGSAVAAARSAGYESGFRAARGRR